MPYMGVRVVSLTVFHLRFCFSPSVPQEMCLSVPLYLSIRGDPHRLRMRIWLEATRACRRALLRETVGLFSSVYMSV